MLVHQRVDFTIPGLKYPSYIGVMFTTDPRFSEMSKSPPSPMTFGCWGWFCQPPRLRNHQELYHLISYPQFMISAENRLPKCHDPHFSHKTMDSLAFVRPHFQTNPSIMLLLISRHIELTRFLFFLLNHHFPQYVINGLVYGYAMVEPIFRQTFNYQFLTLLNPFKPL